MEICWYCYWGWAKPVSDIYIEAVKRLEGDSAVLHYGPSHVVWDDENWGLARKCLDHFYEYVDNFTEKELEICRWSLEELDKVPLSLRCIEPEDYDGEHPALFPPKVETVRR